MGLEQVIDDIRGDGDRRAEAILASAKEEAQGILKEAKERATAYEVQRLTQADKEAELVARQTVSSAEFEARKMVLSTQAALRKELRSRVLESLAGMDAEDREEHVKALLDRAKQIIPDGTVHGSERDEVALGRQKTFKEGKPIKGAGGIIVESSDGMARLDLTYETLLDEAWRDITRQESSLLG